MIPPLSYILIPAVTAFFGALLAIFLTPRFQHYFWKRQMREEIRLGVVTEVNQLAAEFKTNYLLKDMVEHTTEQLLILGKAWTSVDGQVKDFFSKFTYQVFQRMYEYTFIVPLHSQQEIMDRVPRITEFTKIRDAAMRALYTEIGILQGETRWLRFKRWFKK
jgi:hypothetical protein